MNDYRCGACAKLFSVPEYAACPRCGDIGVYVGDLLEREAIWSQVSTVRIVKGNKVVR